MKEFRLSFMQVYPHHYIIANVCVCFLNICYVMGWGSHKTVISSIKQIPTILCKRQSPICKNNKPDFFTKKIDHGYDVNFYLTQDIKYKVPVEYTPHDGNVT